MKSNINERIVILFTLLLLIILLLLFISQEIIITEAHSTKKSRRYTSKVTSGHTIKKLHNQLSKSRPQFISLANNVI